MSRSARLVWIVGAMASVAGAACSSSGNTGGQDGGSGAASGDGTGSSGGTSTGGTSSGGTSTGGAFSGDASTDASASGGDSSVGGAPGAPTGLHQAYNGERGTSFDDGWKFNLGDVTGAEQPTFDDSNWRSLSVPHDWSIELPFDQNSPGGLSSGYLDGGVGWYRKTFSLDASSSGKQIRIEFDGVYWQSQVWINGTSLGTRPCGYTTFEYDMTPYVKVGADNVIAVRVDNSNQPNSRWYTGSGIDRNVWLTTLNPVHIAYSGVFVTTPSVTTGSATVSVATDVENYSAASQSVTVVTQIWDASGTLVTSSTTPATNVAVTPSQTLMPQQLGTTGVGPTPTTLNQNLTVSNPKLWSPDSPSMYQMKVELQVAGATVDRYFVPLGLRSPVFDASTGFSLNGRPMKIQGVAMHTHDFGPIGTRTNYRAIEHQLELLKAMGVNAVRELGKAAAPEYQEIADNLGIMLEEEGFDVWETGKVENDYHLYFTEWGQSDLQLQVRRDRNHPSVIMWSIGNEIGGASTATATKLIGWVKALDTTRPVTWSCNNMSDQTNQSVAGLLDLQGYNYQYSYSSSSNIFDQQHAAHPTWKVFGSETASDVQSRGVYLANDPDVDQMTPCDDSIMQCSSYDDGDTNRGNFEQLYVIDQARSYYFGQFDWSGFDYGGEPYPYEYPGQGQTWPAKSAYFGIIDMASFPKDIYYFYQSRYQNTVPMVHLLPHWNWSTGKTVSVWAYSNCDSVELFLNGTSLGSKSFAQLPTNAASNPVADPVGVTRLVWSVPWAAGTLKAEGSIGGQVVATDQRVTAGEPAQVGLSVDRTTIQADGLDLAFVEADVQDAMGVIVPTATNGVTFAVTGPGSLAGVDNGNPIDVTSYTSPTRDAFNGKVRAIVQSTGQPGTIVVTATSSGLTNGSANVTAM